MCWPHGPYQKSQVARALGIARGTLYHQSRLAIKDKAVAVGVLAWHEQDDTLGHRKLAPLLKMGKNRVKRVMKKYDIQARQKKRRSVYPGKASSIVPNLLREPLPALTAGEEGLMAQTDENRANEEEELATPPEVVFSDIFEICLADRTKVRGCFALWKQTRHILALAFEYHMRADLVVKTINQMPFTVPGTIFHSDQGSQFGAHETRAALLEKGFLRSMSRAGTPTDNGYAERFVGTFKRSVADRRRYRTLGDFLQASENWINFYNHMRPHEGIGNYSPDQFAAVHGLPSVPYLPLL